jgi:lysozyme
MKTSAAGVAAIAFYEGLRTTAYRDSVGVWTIGVGHTAAAGPPNPAAGMAITRQQALDILARDLPKYEAPVNKRMPNVPQHVFDGAVSFCFNVGQGGFASATWPEKYLRGGMAAAESSLKQWNRAKGRTLPGLTIRRAEEADMIFRNRYPNHIVPPEFTGGRKPDVSDTEPVVAVVVPPTPAQTPAQRTAVGAGAVVVAGGVAAASSGAGWWMWAGMAALVLVGLSVAFLIYKKRTAGNVG